MAMLAAPRRKQTVINLRAKNNDWTNDKNKFGQKMLEKMGWSEGKGLGAKENGIAEHVIAKYKNDDKGLGFVDKNDQWTKHEDDFNALLANLSNASTDDNAPSGKSLEKKSKSSKARIHYHKFTRGKDLSRYSAKDLANIFGKKSLKNNDSGNTKQSMGEENSKSSSGQVFTEKGNMNDYFKNKLAALKSTPTKDYSISCEEDVMDYSFQGFSSSGSKGFGYNLNQSEELVPSLDVPNSEYQNEEIETKRKKKKSKSKTQVVTENINEFQSDILEDSPMEPKIKKRKRKFCNNISDINEELNIQECKDEIKDMSNHINKEITKYDAEATEPKTKKKKKSKCKELKPFDTESINKLEPDTEDKDYVKDNVDVVFVKKMKKEKKLETCEDQTHISDPELSIQSHVKRKKKRNKN